MAARSVYNRTTARFSVNWRHPEVEPGDFVSLTHEKLGFVAKAFRVLSTEEGPDGATLVEAVEWNSGIALVAVYNPQTADGLAYSPTSGGNPATSAIIDMVADGVLTPSEKTGFCEALAAIANADANHYSVIKAKLPTGVGTPRQDYEDALAALSSFLTNFMGGIGLSHYYPSASQAQKDALYAWKLETTVVMDGSQAGGEAIRFAFAWVYSAQAKVDAAAAVSPAVAMTALSAPSVTAVTGTPSATTFLRGDGAWATPGGGGTVTGVTGTAPITSSGGATPAIGISAATGSAAGSMSAADKAKLDAATTAGTASTLVLRDSSGQISAVDFISSSDARLKRDVRNLAGSLARVLKLRGKSYRFKGDKAKVRRVGLIAQEVREVVPGVVFEDERGMLSVSYGPLVAELIEAVRELAGRLDRLEGR
jgi:hypothetical protein